MWGLVTDLMQRIPGAPVLGHPHSGLAEVTALFQLLGGNPRLLIWAVILLGHSLLLATQKLPAGAVVNLYDQLLSAVVPALGWLQTSGYTRPSQVQVCLGTGKACQQRCLQMYCKPHRHLTT